MTAIAGIAEPVAPSFVWRPMLPHAADKMVIETAINGGADSIVTFNVRHFKAAAARFGIDVELPGESWARLEEKP